jgi:hypothetical protein
MISCNLCGGLGNQMFQIAATYALALRNNDISIFDFDKCRTPMQGNPSNKYRDNIFRDVNVGKFEPKFYYEELKFSFDEIPYHKYMLLNGYFQSEKYFIDFKDDIKRIFVIDDNDKKLIRDILPIFKTSNKPITSVNIRRGDYLKNQNYHNICPYEYFKKSIDLIGDSYFIFISDDLNWVKENFKNNDNYFFPNLKSDILDLSIMTMCNNNIISNSSFGWWGAYLNDTKNSLKIAPGQWFGEKGPSDTNDIIPNNWIKLKF